MTEFVELYRECTEDLDLSGWDLCRKLHTTPEALTRRLYNHHLPVPPELNRLVNEERNR